MTVRDVILISAYGADPDIPSEPFIAWTFTRVTLEHAERLGLETVVLTNRRSAVALRQAKPSLTSDFTILEVGLPAALRWLERPRISMLARVEYLAWNVIARRRVRQLGRERNLLLAHHVSFATEILPTPISAAPRSTFKVWGPIGADGVADVFRIRPRSRATWTEYAVQRLRDLLSRTMSRRRARTVDLVLAQSPALERSIGTATPVRAFPNLLLDAPPALREAEPGSTLSLLSVGHLVPRKRFELSVAALTDPRLADATLHIVGRATGLARNYVAEYAEQVGVADRVVFHGQLDRREVLEMMTRCSVLVHPTGREGASGVVGEAATVGIPVVCFEGTGAAAIMREAGTSGAVVAPRADCTPADLADAIIHAAGLPRVTGPAWGADRFSALVGELLVEARERRSS